MDSSDTMGLGDGIRVLEESTVLDGASINGNGRKVFESGSLEIDNMYGGGRVAELKSRNHGWESSGVMDLVGRVLDGKFQMDSTTEDVNISESGPEVNLASDTDPWQGIVGEPTSKDGIGIEDPIINKDPDNMNLDFRVGDAWQGIVGEPTSKNGIGIEEEPLINKDPGNLDYRVEGNGLNGDNQDSIVPNEMVPDCRTETEEEKVDVLIPRERGECITEKEGEYYMSDLVWGKVRCHPWWPGQIFDPSAASDQAKSLCKRNRYLIAYFGDQTFAWNEVSKIRPFRMHFSQMEKQSNTDGFCCAVECALDEVARQVELGLSCPCLPQEVHAALQVQEVEKTGTQEESTRRAGVDNIYGATSFSSGELMQFLESLAHSPKCETDRLQLTTMKAQLLSFNRWKGFNHLPIYEECARFLEDLSESTLKGKAKESLQGPGLENTNNFPSKKREMTVRGSYSQKRKCLSGDVGNPKIKKRRLSELMFSSNSGIHNGKKPTKCEISPPEIPHPDVILSELIFAAKHPKQGHEAKISIVTFLCGLRNTICLEKSIPGGTAQETVEPTNADLSKGEYAEDSYWTDRIIQNHSENPAFSALDNASKRTAELDLTTVAVLNSDGSKEREIVAPDNVSKGVAELDATTVSFLNSGSGKKREIVFVDSDAEDDSSIPKSKAPEEEHFPTALLLNFTSLDSVPSIRNLNAIFRRFGPIKESETEILTKSKRAKVTFKRREHAEAAFSSTGKFSIFGPSLLSYRLNYAPTIKKYRATAKRSKKATSGKANV